MGGKKHRLLQRSEEILIGLRVLDRFELVLGIGAYKELRFAAWPDTDSQREEPKEVVIMRTVLRLGPSRGSAELATALHARRCSSQ